MPSQDFPSVDGYECSWADLTATALLPGQPNIPLSMIEAIKWDSKLEVGKTRGASGGRVMKETAGSETTTGSITCTRWQLHNIIEALEAAAMASGVPGIVRGNEVIISAVRFDIMVQHTPIGDTRIYENKLSGCRFRGYTNDLKQGNDADLIEVPIDPIRVATRSTKTGQWMVLR
jgi:hypothetical protein